MGNMKRLVPHLFVLCIVAGAVATGANVSIRTALEDLRKSATPRAATGDIVLVAIDPPSLEKIGVWPWPRTLHAQIIEKLEKAGAQDVVFDVDFSAASTKSADDAFSEALQAIGGSVVLPAFKQRGADGKLHVNLPLEAFRARTWSALVNVAPDRDGVARSYPYGDTVNGEVLPSMAALLAGRQSVTGGSFSIDFGISPDTVRTISYVDVLEERPEAINAVRNKRVIIGGTALELGDRFNIPNGKIISGPMLQVLAAESIAQDRDLRPLPGWYGTVIFALVMLAMGLFWPHLRSGWRAALPLCVAVAAELGAGWLQSVTPFILDTSLLHIAGAAYLLAVALHEIDFSRLLNTVAEKRFHRMAMALGDGLVCADADGIITVWNPGAKKIFGYEAREALGKHLRILFQTGQTMPTEMTKEELQSPGGRTLETVGRRKNGETFQLEVCFSGWQGTDDFQYGALLRDVSERYREAERIRYLAEFDTLTGLANRHSFSKLFNAAISECPEDKSDLALLYIDLDNFKHINDVQGHGCGDRVLAVVGERLTGLMEKDDIVSRLGGDEFAVLVVGNDALKRVDKLAPSIIASLGQVYDSFLGRTLDVGASVGAAFYPRDGRNVEELLSNADLALYEAKSNGRGQHVIFESAFREKLEGQLSLNAELKAALKQNEFELFYQPQISLINNRVVGAEALIRWRHPHRGLLAPGAFMAAVNATDISDDVAYWVLRQACAQARQWQDDGHSLRVGVNLSPSQLQTGDLAAVVAQTLRETGLSPCNLELEVTEDIVLADEEKALQCFRAIQELGVQLAFDDFGTGYGSLSYLRKFPLNVLKIDKSFVFNLVSSPADIAIVRTMISLSAELGLSVIAEGIEDSATAELLRRLGCQEAQGYLYGKPMPATAFAELYLTGDTAVAVA